MESDSDISGPSTSTSVALASPQVQLQPESVASVLKAFHEVVRDPESLERAAEYLYDSLLDDATLGIFLEVHRLYKTGNLDALLGESDEDGENAMVDMPNYDVFGVSTTKKPQDCICPHCERAVAASRFAPHLEKCMGMGRVSSRIASRRLATKESTAASTSAAAAYLQSSTGASDDDQDDVDWSMEKRRKKPSQHSRSSSKK